MFVPVCAGKELTLAQKLSRGKGTGQREQEDAQEFLTFLLDSTHQELLKLRAMYGTSGREPRPLYGTPNREPRPLYGTPSREPRPTY